MPSQMDWCAWKESTLLWLFQYFFTFYSLNARQKSQILNELYNANCIKLLWVILFGLFLFNILVVLDSHITFYDYSHILWLLAQFAKSKNEKHFEWRIYKKNREYKKFQFEEIETQKAFSLHSCKMYTINQISGVVNP